MVNQSVMVGTQLPLVHVRSQALGEVRCRLIQALKQERIAPGDRISAKRPIWSFQQLHRPEERRSPLYGARVLRKETSAHVFLKMALPHLVDTGRDRVLVEIEIPMDQALPRLLGDVAGRSDFAQQRDQ